MRLSYVLVYAPRSLPFSPIHLGVPQRANKRLLGLKEHVLVPEMEMGQWVMGQMGHHFWMGHVDHGSLPVTHDYEISVQ